MSSPQRVYSIAEAAELTGLSVKALRNRCDRGQLRTLKRGGVRMIPLTELQRAGLLELEGAGAELERAAGDVGELVNRELLGELAKAHERIGELQAITERSESTLREERDRAELELARMAEELARVAELELELERLRSRGLLARLRNR